MRRPAEGSRRLRAIMAVVLLGALSASLSASLCAQEVPLQEDVPTEAEAIALLIRSVAEESAIAVASSCGAEPLLLRVLPEDVAPVVTQVFAEEMIKRGIAVRTTGEGAEHTLTVEVRALRSSTVSSGNSAYLRKIETVLGLHLERRDGSVPFSHEVRREREDALAGDPPYDRRNHLREKSSWWQSWIEPALVTVTAVVVVVLLFTVRGSS
ncbi:MAG: hypothetical protein KFF77_09825 [Bacteroidetes bacterium]|nr:hypothetical protein [Bacteroidota bacterium]